MTQFQDVFMRYEKKYLLSSAQFLELQKGLEGKACEDEHGLHTICNIYYDTRSYELIRTSLEKPVYKEKLRLRSYGIPSMESTVFLELKKKYEGVVYKRRIPLTLAQAELYLGCGIRPENGGQILKEIDWFLHWYQPSPRVFLAYDRVALYGCDDPGFRLTFDRNIRFRQEDLSLAEGDRGNPVLHENQVLMEVKIPGVIPLWFSHLLNSLEIFPVSFSKYGTCYQKHLLPSILSAGGVTCA